MILKSLTDERSQIRRQETVKERKKETIRVWLEGGKKGDILRIEEVGGR